MFKGKKPEKVAFIKAHIGSRMLSGMEQENPLHEKTSTSGSESDVVERIVGSETSSTELSDERDSAVLHTVVALTSRYGRKRTRVLRDNYVPWQNIEM